MTTVRFFSIRRTALTLLFLFQAFLVFCQNGKDVKSGLSAQWDFEEASDTIIDGIGAANGRLMDASIQRVEGTQGKAISFINTTGNNYIEIDHSEEIEFDSTQSFSLSALVKCDFVNHTGEMHIVAKGAYNPAHYPGGKGKWMALSYKNQPANGIVRQLRFSIDDNITKSQAVYPIPEDFDEDAWHHIVCVRNKETNYLSIYMDGQLMESSIDLTTNSIASGLPLFIGNYYTLTTPFSGLIDDVRMYQGAMPLDSVTVLYDFYDIASIASAIQESNTEFLSNFSVYPNPATSIIQVELPEGSMGNTLQIFSLVGKRVYSQTIVSDKFTLKVSELSKGVYFLQINGAVKKIVIE